MSQPEDLSDEALRISLGATARQARKRLGLTQEDVAERLDMAPEVYGRLERGTMAPSIFSLRKLCLALNLSADLLLDTDLSTASLEDLPGPTPQAVKESKYVRRIMRRAPGLTPSSLRLLAQLTLMLPTKAQAARRSSKKS